jgi:hypothetical protein
LQNHVEKEHGFKTRSKKDALAHSIKAAWESWDASILQKVYDRWVKVLDLIIMDGGNNKMLNSHQGEHFVPLVLPNPSLAGSGDEGIVEGAGTDDDDDGAHDGGGDDDNGVFDGGSDDDNGTHDGGQWGLLMIFKYLYMTIDIFIIQHICVNFQFSKTFGCGKVRAAATARIHDTAPLKLAGTTCLLLWHHRRSFGTWFVTCSWQNDHRSQTSVHHPRHILPLIHPWRDLNKCSKACCNLLLQFLI